MNKNSTPPPTFPRSEPRWRRNIRTHLQSRARGRGSKLFRSLVTRRKPWPRWAGCSAVCFHERRTERRELGMKIDANKLRAFVKAHAFTNTSMAAKAAISRQALQTMLRENGIIEVRDRTVRGLVQALRLADESLLSPDPLAGYKKAVADENADLGFA